jgi:hypothetical protein
MCLLVDRILDYGVNNRVGGIWKDCGLVTFADKIFGLTSLPHPFVAESTITWALTYITRKLGGKKRLGVLSIYVHKFSGN